MSIHKHERVCFPLVVLPIRLTFVFMNEGSTVLLADDDENDALFFERAVAKSSFAYRVQVARSVSEAINYLIGLGEFANREKFPFPKFIITGSNMPLVNGGEFLRWLKSHPIFSVVPTILLGSSEAPSDIEHAYDELGIHAYIVKPGKLQQLEYIVKLIFDFWAVLRGADLEVEK